MACRELENRDLPFFFKNLEPGQGPTACLKNSKIFWQGDPAEAVFYVVAGYVKISALSPDGRDAIVAVITEGGFFGEASLAGRQDRATTATAMTDCELVQVERGMFARHLESDPDFARTFMAHMLKRAIRCEEDLIDHLVNPSEKRLARALILLADADGAAAGPARIVAKISQETLAEMIGTTRSRVSFFMNKFRRLGFIRYGETLEIFPSLLTTVLNEGEEHDRLRGNDGNEPGRSAVSPGPQAKRRKAPPAPIA